MRLFILVLPLFTAAQLLAESPPSSGVLAGEAQIGKSLRPANRDHVCGGGIPDCAACCLPGGCLEVSRTDCVFIHDGNPQEPGSDCHDFSGDGTADACEPEFPLCLPSNDQLTCEGQCPGPLPCNATKVRVNLTTFQYEVLECGCRLCHVCLECDAFPPPCIDSCPNGDACVRTETCYSNEICDIECNCQPEQPEACCLTSFDVTCQERLPADCLAIGGIPQGPGSVCLGHEACCLPDGSCTFVDRICCDDLGGVSQGSGSMCQGTGTCCYDITDDFCLYDTCLEQDGVCCAANGGVFQGVGTACEIEACCIDGLCCDLDADCCVISGGVAAGAGSACAGIQGACCYDGDGDFVPEVCIIADEACCADLGGYFHGPNTMCSPNVGACCFGFVFGYCQDNINETCCNGIEAGLFVGDGTLCLGDNNGNGFDDACEAALCTPNPAGNACEPTQCPNNQEVCVPTKVKCTPSGAVCTIIECTCQDPNKCHIDMPPGWTLPACFGGCPPGEACKEIITIDPDDGQFVHTCTCVATEACCSPIAGIRTSTAAGCSACDDICCEETPECCVVSGGVPAGPGTSCSGVQGACCYDGDADGVAEVCIIADATCCADLNGYFHGPGTTCSPNFGACCFGVFGGSCVEMNESCCADLQGSRFLGNGSVCLGDSDGDGLDDACFGPDQGCCLGDEYNNACIFVVPPACVSKGGVPQGIGTDCSAPVACCLPSGRCVRVDPLCCDDLGGTPRGPGTFCEPYGDIHPKPGDGIVELGDVLKVLAAFADSDPCTNFPNAELVYNDECPQDCVTVADCIGGPPTVCSNLGRCCAVVDISDILAMLAAYADNPRCPDGACR